MWNELSVRHLLALRAVAEEGTFGRAATRLGFTQSAVSQQVAALEQMTGQTLFERPSGPRRPELTNEGRLLLKHGNAILDRINHAQHDLDRYARGQSGKLVIGTFQSVSARILPSALRLLREVSPEVEVSLVQDEPDLEAQSASLGRGDTDVAFIIGRPAADLDGRYLGADPFVAMVPADYPPGPVELASIDGKPMIGEPLGNACGMLVERELERLGIAPNHAFRSHDNGAVQGMVSAGVGISIVALLTVDTTDPTISIRPTIPEVPARELSIIWRKGHALSPVAVSFVDIVTTRCAEILATAPVPK